jgi:hypothetical protein
LGKRVWRVKRMDLVFGLAWERGLEVTDGSVWSTEGCWVEVARVVIREVRRARVEGREILVAMWNVDEGFS